jgi:hypothetical protein
MKSSAAQEKLSLPIWKLAEHSFADVLQDPRGAKYFSYGDYGQGICELQRELIEIAKADDKTGTLAGFLEKEFGSYGLVTLGFLSNLESRSVIAIKHNGRRVDGAQLRDLKRKVEQIRLASQTISLSRVGARGI